MNNIKKLFSLLCLCPLLAGAQKYVGGDISLLPTYEEHGVHYLDTHGTQVQLLPYLGREAGWNAMRVRLFVDPSKAPAAHRQEGVRQDLDYVTALARRIKAEGYALMLDFHYSDTWTDPGQHATPSAWTSSDPSVLADSVYRYTVRCLEHLKANGVAPDLIQPGNEVTFGMLWPTGRCYPDGSQYGTGSFSNFVGYLQAGVKGCREVCPQAKIIVHTELSSVWNVTTFYNTLGNRVDYDIIGLSYYPDYHGPLSTLASTLTTLEAQHADKDIMIVETGYGARWSLNGDYSSAVQRAWPVTEAGQRQFTLDLIGELARHSRVTGLFWWLPEDNEFWADKNPARSSWWNASLYTQNTGRPLAALFELQRFVGLDPTGIAAPPLTDSSRPAAGTFWPSAGASQPSVNASQSSANTSDASPVYTLQGVQLPAQASLRRGVYVQGGKKIVR